MPIFQEFTDAIANENLKVNGSWPSQRLTHSTMEFDRSRTQMADNAVERQNSQNKDYGILNSRLMKDIVKPDVESATAYKEIATGISPTSQGFQFANQNQQISGSVTTTINQLQSTVSSMQAMMYQVFDLIKK